MAGVPARWYAPGVWTQPVMARITSNAAHLTCLNSMTVG
ncbi:hypothetical protein BN2364_0334 [Alloalcanivorax xenomutans]|nr:hypothetical protein BN2364_0334 [Alloalcanivorax xenomutans]